MSAFEDVHRDRIAGSLAMFDRMIFKGRVTSLYKQDGARAFLWSQGVPITEFTAYAKRRRNGSPTPPESWRRTRAGR